MGEEMKGNFYMIGENGEKIKIGKIKDIKIDEGGEEMKFKVGDIVRGIGKRYGTTNKYMYKGKVINIQTDGTLDIKVLDHKKKSNIDKIYYGLEPEYFRLIKYTYEDLKKSPIGTKVTYDDGKVFIKTGMNTYSKEICSCISEVRNYDDMFQGKIIKIEEPEYSRVYEKKVEILDEAEKRYLRNVIRPFRDKVSNIRKDTNYNQEYISIYIEQDSIINLPNFKEGTMYKGMELRKFYKLEELGI